MALDLSPALSELVLFIGVLALILIGAFREQEANRLLTPLAVIVLLVAAITAIAHGSARELGFGGHFVFDGYAAFLKVLIMLGSAGSLMLAIGYLRDEKIERFEFKPGTEPTWISSSFVRGPKTLPVLVHARK